MSTQETEAPAEVVEPEADEDPLVALAREEEAARAGTDTGQAPAEEAPPAQETPQETAERLWAGKFQNENELERGYTNLESEIGRLRNELGTTRQQLDTYQQTYQPPAGQPQPQQQGGDDWPEGLPVIEQEELEQMMFEKPLEAVAYVSALMTQSAIQQLRQELTGQLEPVYKTVNKSAAAGTVAQLKEQFGDEVVLRNKEAIAAMIEGDPDFFTDPDTRFARLRMTVQAAEFERMNGNRHGERADNGQFASAGEVQRTAHMEGGSTAAPQPPRALTPEDEILAGMERVRPQKDLFGDRPGVARVVE